MLCAVVAFLACFSFASPNAVAQSGGSVLFGGPAPVSAGYFDPAYTRSENRQHLGVDFTASAGSDVYAPVEGDIVVNRTYDADVMQAYLVIRSAQGSEHVLGHISSSLIVGTHVTVGERVGAVRAWPGEPRRSHVHWGINRTGVAQAMRDDWGWGRAPASASGSDAANRGWLNPNDVPARAPLRRQEIPTDVVAPPRERPQEGVYYEPNFFGRRPMGNKVLWEINCQRSPRLGCETLRRGPFVLFATNSPHRARFTALVDRLGNCPLFCPGRYEVEEDNYSAIMVSTTQMILRTVAVTRDRYGDELRNIGSVVLDVRASGSDQRMPWQIWNVLEAPGIEPG